MAEFTIKIAGGAVRVSSLFESTRDYCHKYLTEEPPAFSVTVSREELVSEQARYDAEAREEGLRLRRFSEPFLERSVIQQKVAEALFDRDILMFHGSLVAVDGEGYLFTAKCGTGKSTHTRLWREVFGSRAVMVNDDKPFLQITDSGVQAFGAPWSGKHGLDTNVAVPLKGICILQRGSENHIQRITREDALAMLHHQGCCPPAPEARLRYPSLIHRLAEKTALWQMTCNKNPEAALVAYEAMSANQD